MKEKSKISKRSNSRFDFENNFNRRLKSNRSQEAIIVTVLLILIVIASIAVIALWIIPMIKTNLEVGNIKVDLYINPESTFYNERTSYDCGGLGPNDCVGEARTYVKVTRGVSESGNPEIYGIKFAFTQGDKTLLYYNKNIPGQLESRTYSFMLSAENGTKPDYVEISPIVIINGKQRTLQTLDKVEFRTDNSVVPREKLEMCSVPIESSSGGFPPNPLNADCSVN